MPFDPLVSSAGRLRILTALAGEPAQDFVELRRATGLTDGNLSAHARRLQGAGLVQISKSFRDGKPVTSFALTSSGRDALRRHAEAAMAAIHPDRPATLPSSPEPAMATASAEDDWID